MDSIERLVVDGFSPIKTFWSLIRWTDHLKSAVGGPLQECTKACPNRESDQPLINILHEDHVRSYKRATKKEETPMIHPGYKMNTKC